MTIIIISDQFYKGRGVSLIIKLDSDKAYY